MARRKNKKKPTTPARQAEAQKTRQEERQSELTSVKAGSDPVKRTVIPAEKKAGSGTRISIPTCMAGMFLSLVLGIYLGTLLPETLHQLDKRDTASVPVKNETGIKTAGIPEKNQSMSGKEPSPPQAGFNSNLAKQLAELEKAVRDDPSEANWIGLGNLYFDTAQPEKAVHAYEHALAIRPANPDVLTDLGIMYRELRQPNKALECFRAASNIDPNHVNALFNEGVVLAYDLDDKADAVKAWEKLVKIKPEARSPSGQSVTSLIEEMR